MIDDSQDSTVVTRRGALGVIGAGVAAGLAGCSGGSGDTTTTQSTTTQSTTQQTTSGSTAPYIVSHDTVVSAETPAVGQGPCSLQNRFLHGQIAVFRAKVIDPETGNELGGDSLGGVTVTINSGSGATVPLAYSGHPPGNATDHYWVGLWKVPDGFPTGPVDYTIDVKGDHPAKTVKFDIPPSSLTVLQGTYTPPKTNSTNSTN